MTWAAAHASFRPTPRLGAPDDAPGGRSKDCRGERFVAEVVAACGSCADDTPQRARTKGPARSTQGQAAGRRADAIRADFSEDEMYSVGDTVRRKTQPEAVGIVLSRYQDPITGQWIYRVQFGNRVLGLAETELELLPEHTSPWDDIREGVFGSAEAFRTRMTFERLRRPPSPIAASFGSAKAAFYPFQFKPLLKFLENPRKRLLIADDVGLGKTIEAGYIIRELRSRVSLERVLLVVPSRLRTKWQDEMERRFGERFDIVAGRQLYGLRQRMETRQELGRFSWIVSIESARAEGIIRFLDDLQPSIDVVVVDEAHRMRNSATHQHRLERLCRRAPNT